MEMVQLRWQPTNRSTGPANEGLSIRRKETTAFLVGNISFGESQKCGFDWMYLSFVWFSWFPSFVRVLAVLLWHLRCRNKGITRHNLVESFMVLVASRLLDVEDVCILWRCFTLDREGQRLEISVCLCASYGGLMLLTWLLVPFCSTFILSR